MLTLAAEPVVRPIELTALASPAAESASVVRAMAGTYARAVAEAVAERAPPGFAAAADFVIRHRNSIDGDLGWDRATGAAHDALSGGSPHDEALAELALRLGAAGHAGEWAIELGVPRPWRFGDLLFPPARRIAFEGGDGCAHLQLDDRQPMVLTRTRSSWIAPDVGVAERLAALDFGTTHHGATLCPGEDLFPFRDARPNSLLRTPFPAFWIGSRTWCATLCHAPQIPKRCRADRHRGCSASSASLPIPDRRRSSR